MKRFTNHPEQWGTFVDVKYWDKIKNAKKYAGKELFIGSVTDPYMPLEEKYRRTRTLLEEMQGSGCKISIATKSDLVLRDLDLIKTFQESRVSWSINTLDEKFRREMDNSVSIERKIDAMKKFYQAGIRTTCFISPIFPEITDVKSIILKTKDYCNLVWLENLNLRGDYKARILNYIKEKHSSLYPIYDEIYNKGNSSKLFLSKDIRILASLDPIAIDQACLDLVYNSEDLGQRDFNKKNRILIISRR